MGNDSFASCATKCNRDRRCLSFTYWQDNYKCYTKYTSHATGARPSSSPHSKWYEEKCVDRPQHVAPPPPPQDDPKDAEITKMKAAILKQCQQSRRDENNCTKTCMYEQKEDAEIDQLKCKLAIGSQTCQKEREDKCMCDKVCQGETSKETEIAQLKCKLNKDKCAPSFDLKACQQERKATNDCNKKCQGEDPKVAELNKLKCELASQGGNDLKTCQQERKASGDCNKKCDGEDPKKAELAKLEC